MTRYINLLIFIIGLGCLAATGVEAALDAARQRPRQADTPVWWDNIEDPPFWVRGPRPKWNRAWKMHTVLLQPGQTVTLRLPRGRALRVFHPTRRLTRHDLNLSLSNGSGLHVFQTPQYADDQQSLILTPSPLFEHEVHISRAAQHQHPLSIALFLSRYDPLPVAPYRDFIALDLPAAQLQTGVKTTAQRFWSLKPYASVQVSIKGPARLAVENRFAYDLTVNRPKQTYRIYTRLDQAPLRTLEFATDAELSQPVFIGGKPQNVSRLEVDYVDIPPGRHTLALQSTAPVYLRLLRQSHADYLLPKINWPPALSHVTGVTPPLLYTPIWQIDPSQLRQRITSLTSSVAELEYLAKRLRRDNRHRDGGLQAAMLLHSAAAMRPHDAPLQRAAARQLGASTMHRHLLPAHKTAGQPQYSGWFVTPRLAPLHHEQTPYAAATQHQSGLTSQLKSGYFVTLPADPHSHHYVLPPRSAPSELRFAADTTALSQPQELWLQFDQQPPTRMHLMPQAAPAAHHRLPTPGRIGLTLLRLQNPAFDNGTLGGPFSARHTPARFLRTAHTVLPLPAHVQRVKVWQTYNRSEAVAVALQYRVSKPFRLSERSYLDALQRLGSPAARYDLVLGQLTALQHGPATFDTHVHPQREAIEIVNQWQPLMRLLRARYKRFAAALTPPQPQPAKRPLPDADQLRRQAQHAETTGDWLAALEAWSPIARTAQGQYRREAHMGQVQALQHLGRHALADRLLRGMMLFDADAQLRLQAFNRLLAIYRQTGNAHALNTLLTVAAIRQLHPNALSLLITQLTAEGQYQHALQLGLALPISQRPITALLQCAWRLGWWQAFDHLLQHVYTAEERHYWLGYRAVHQAAYDTAQHHFLLAGVKGQAVSAAIAQAGSIHADLRSKHAVRQEDATLNWEDWQARHPGPLIWQREPQHIIDYAGTARLYQPTLDLHSQWYRSEAERPVQLRFLGPLRLRVSVRPLHPKSDSSHPAQPLEGWVHIDHDTQRHLLPILSNHPTSDLIALDNAQWQPGQLVMEELDFGPGLHTVTISGQTIPLLIQTEVQRPALPLGILPPLTPSTLYAAQYLRPTTNFAHTPRKKSCAACLYVTDAQPFLVAMQHHLLVHQPPMNPLHTTRPAASEIEVYRVQKAKFVFQQDLQAALALPVNPSDDGLRQRMILLLWQAEHQPEHYEEALSAAQALLAAHPAHPRLPSLFAHLARRSKWQRLAAVQRSAGLHYAERQGWHPESPLLRANAALMRPVSPNEHMVTGAKRLLVTLDNLKPAEFDITLEANELPYAPGTPITAVYQIDAQAPVQVQLTPGHPGRSVRLSIPEGQHALRFYIQNPVVNQFLRLKIVEQRHPAAHPLPHTFERAYHVATQAEPVEVMVAGPSWLRIDRLSQAGMKTHYQKVAAGWQTLQFHPEPGQPEALLRLFQRIPAPEAERLAPRQPAYEPDVVLSPLAYLPPVKRYSLVKLHDEYPLGQQEDGTWTFGSQLVSRRNTQEDVSLSDDERFIALTLTHRYTDGFRRFYFETEAIGRGRTDGGPTLGLKHILAYRPARRDLTLRISGTGYMQLPIQGTDLAGSGLFRLSVSHGFTLGPKAKHRPAISLFARLLSLDEAQAQATDGRIDLDVFSTFKSDHQVGLRLSETFTYRPWLDTIWSGKLNVVTNQDLNPLQPDHVTLRLEWKQLIGALQLHSAYRFGYFLADDDRRKSIDRHTLILEARWEHWRPSRQRFEIRLRTRYDLRTGDLGLFLGLSWHTGAGRAYRDFRPGTVPFRRLRQYRIPSGRANRLM